MASVALLIASSAPLSAQTSAIRGIVRDSTRRPLPDAEVMVMTPERRVRTDSAGNFYISGLAAGQHTLRARRLGYYMAQTVVTLGANTEKQLIFELEKRPVLLDTVNVTATCGRFDFASFVCRRRSGGNGEFLDEYAIDSANPRFISDIFRRPGFRVEAVRGGLAVKSLTGWRCMTSIVNGRPASVTNPPPQSPKEILGMEIYKDPKDVPAYYKGYAWGATKAGRRMLPAPCTLVIYWTTVKPNRR